jgi:diadenylate cyclase
MRQNEMPGFLLEQLAYYLDRFSRAPLNNALDILLVALTIFAVLLLVRGTRAVPLLRGLIALALLFLVLASFVELPAFGWLVSNTLPALLLAFPVIFQPELRRALEQLGRAGRYVRLFRRQERSPLVEAMATACLRLSQRRHGALLVIEQDTGLQEYVDTGIVLNAEPSPELFLTIFNKTTELHDGAVIVRGEKLAAAACVMPLSTRSLSDRQMGLRHRAALGISEVSDAVVVIVSEETGQISIAHNGRIIPQREPAQLAVALQSFIQNPRQRTREEQTRV